MHSEVPARLAEALASGAAAGLTYKACESWDASPAVKETARTVASSLAGYAAATIVNTVMCDPAGAVSTHARTIYNVSQGTYQ
ncbi:MAG: hypothetical protein AB4352_12525 [Hormoscilla sp.]